MSSTTLSRRTKAAILGRVYGTYLREHQGDACVVFSLVLQEVERRYGDFDFAFKTKASYILPASYYYYYEYCGPPNWISGISDLDYEHLLLCVTHMRYAYDRSLFSLFPIEELTSDT